MPYPPRQIPDAPLPISMIPQAETLSGTDIVVVVQPLNAPGQKVRTMTLSQLASFIAAGELGEIVFVNVNGFRSTVGKNGYSYHHDADQSYNANLDYAIDSNGIHAVLATSGYTKKFETDGTKAVITKTESGLTDKVEVFDNYIQLTHQTRVGNQVVNLTSKLGWDELRARILRVMIDENNAIPLYWDDTNAEFVVWDRTNNSKVGLPKAHVHGTLEVEKDTTIRADVNITKTITVAGRADFNGNFTVIKNLYATDYAETYCRLKTARLNLKNEKSYFTVSSNTNINTLIAGVSEQIAVAEGDIVTLRNNSNTDIEVVMGLRKVTLNAFCAMQFICHGTDGTNTQWAPLGNATVTLA